MYANNDRKYVVVLNQRHALPTQMNALAHVAIGVGFGVDKDGGRLLDYCNDSARLKSKISEFPVIVLAARNSSQLRSLMVSAVEKGIAHNTFVTAMLGSSAVDQLQQTASAVADSLDFVAVLLFGQREDLDPLTRRFSLVRASEQDVDAG
jgi:hypothetical protein